MKKHFPLTTISAEAQIKIFGEVVITPDTELLVDFYKSGYTTDPEHIYPKTELKKELFVHKFATYAGYTDCHPYEILKYNTPTKITVREMDAELDPNFKCNTIIGGFVGHVTNSRQQSYTYISNPEYREVAVRYSKAKRGWFCKYGRRFILATTPYKYYDYNF